MTTLQAINELQGQEELLQKLLQAGVVVPSKLIQAEIYSFYIKTRRDLFKERCPTYRGRAMLETVRKYNISQDTVYRIIKDMEQ